MDINNKVIVWDLDNTLYAESEEFKSMLDEAAAIAAVEDLGLDLDLETAKAKVTESYKLYRDGGEIFVQEYGLSPKAIFEAYHKRKPIDPIVPYPNLLEKLEKLPCPQYILSASSRDVCTKILKHLGLYDFFEGRYYSVEDFGYYKKNESAEVYKAFCKKVGINPEDIIFVDDSYSYLEFAKETGMTTVRIYYKNNSAKGKKYIDYAYKGIESFLEAVTPQQNRKPTEAKFSLSY